MKCALKITMSYAISKMYGLGIYDTNGAYLGRANDFIIDLEKGEVIRITTEPIRSLANSKTDATKILQKKSVLYKRVRSVKDIIVVQH